MAAAKEAFPGWSARSPQQRADILNKLADLVEANLEELAQAESRDQGVPYSVVNVTHLVTECLLFSAVYLPSLL